MLGWCNFNYVNMDDDARDSGMKEVESYFEIFRIKTVRANRYTAQKSNDVSKKAYKIYTSKKEKAVPGFKAAKFRLTLMLRCNADEGDNLKLYLVHNLENLYALKNMRKFTCSVCSRLHMQG